MSKSVITNRYIIGYVRKYLSPREDENIRKEDILKNVIENLSTGAHNDYKITIMAPTIKESKDYYNIIDNGVIHFTTALNEILVIKNIKEFYVNDICVDMDVNTI